MKFSSLIKGGAAALYLSTSASWATGMVPETSVVIVEQKDGEGAINVKNTDVNPVLLVTTLKNIKDDNVTSLLSVTPPAARVDSNKNQRVRFIMTDKTPLKTERLGRVIFEGVPPQKKGENVVRMTVRQNLPVLIRPAELPRDDAPWKRLVWKHNGNQLTVSNDSPYVVRLNQAVQTLPDNVTWSLPESYILPGQHLTLKPDEGKKSSTANSVRLAPATTWGYAVKSYDALIVR